MPVELHEDEVPDLHIALVVFAEGLVFTRLARLKAEVVINLATWAAGAGLAHLPEVIFRAKLVDALLWNACVQPELLGLIVARRLRVAFEDGDVEPVFVDAEPVGRGQQFPRIRDGIFLEVVAEGEVAEHLEEGVVAACEADVLKVVMLAARAHALLRRGGAHIGPLLRSKERVLELVHARVGEQQRGVVVRHKRRRVHAAVPLFLKKTQEIFANLASGAVLHGL